MTTATPCRKEPDTMSGPQYDPQSTDSMFARILANQETDHLEREAFRSEMREMLAAHGKRINLLELFAANLKGKIAVFSTLAGALAGAVIEWAKNHFGGGGGGSTH